MTATSSAAYQLAVEVAWHGHTSTEGAARLADRAGIDAALVPVALAVAVRTGLLREVPRLGGFAAGRTVNADVFGHEFAAFMAGE